MSQNGTVEIKLADVVYRDDLYPRGKPSPEKIQEYSENIDQLPPIELDQHNILIDGYHRWKAHELAKVGTIAAKVTQVESEAHLELLAVLRNAKHGYQLSRDDKRRYAVRWWDVRPVNEIVETLSISETTFNRWTKNKRQDREKEIKERIFAMWMACHTQQEIADEIGVDVATVNRKITDFLQNNQMDELQIFRNFSPELYTLWNFQKLTNKVKVFGSVPQEIVDNLLYYYTKPFDIVFDPFGGGGATIDRCLERFRRYYVSDLTPTPARDDLREWDITQGLPDDLPVPDFVFLDPPYWLQAKGKYSAKETDLGNVGIDSFLQTIADITKAVKRKWNSGRPDARLAIIISPFYREGEYVDLPLLCHQTISKYLDLCERIQVPYTTQIVQGDEINKAKTDKRMIHRIRDLMIYKGG